MVILKSNKKLDFNSFEETLFFTLAICPKWCKKNMLLIYHFLLQIQYNAPYPLHPILVYSCLLLKPYINRVHIWRSWMVENFFNIWYIKFPITKWPLLLWYKVIIVQDTMEIYHHFTTAFELISSHSYGMDIMHFHMNRYFWCCIK